MKISSYILIALLPVLLAACSAADAPEGSGSKATADGLISYTVSAAQTRTAISGTTFPTDNTFCVYAYEGTEATPFIDGEVVSCLNGTVWATKDNYYWPDGTVNFFAIYPTTLSFNTATKTLSYTVPTDISLQDDVLYETVTTAKDDAIVTGNTTKANAVPLTFHHALSQIAFKGKISSDNQGWTVDVSKIEICNVNGSGTLDLTQATKTWTNLSAPADYEVGLRSGIGTLAYYESGTTTVAEAQNLTADDGVLLLMPQVLTAWDNTAVNVTTATNTGCYLAVTCYIRSASEDIRGTTTTHQTVYVPFDNGTTGWLAGKKYTYTLNFGAGLDADGNGITTDDTTAITITTTVTDWTDGGSESVIVD